MMKTIFASATFAAALATFTVVGCSSSSNNGNGNGTPGVDGGGTSSSSGGSGSGSGGVVTPGRDGGASSSSGGSAGNPPLPDGSVLPHGNQLVATGDGGAVTLVGITSDDFAVYLDDAKGTWAIKADGTGKAISLGTVPKASDVTVIGNAVILSTSDTKGLGAASIWTSSASAPASLSTSTLVGSYGVFAVSADGTHVAFVDTVSTDGSTAAIAVAATDGSGKATLVPSIDINDCNVQIAFAAGSVVTAACPIVGGVAIDAGEPDGGTNLNVATVTAFASGAWTPSVLATGVQLAFTVDATGKNVAVNGPLGTQVVPVAGGAALTIDATGVLGAGTSLPGVFASDGAHLVYTTATKALEKAATVAPPAPLALAPAGTFADVFHLSPDGNWVIGSLNAQGTDQGDLYLSSATTAGTPVTLSTDTGSALFGDPFTADSTQALFYTAVAQSGVGTLNAQGATATKPTVLGTNVWLDFATTGGKVLFNDNDTTGYADLRAADTSGTAAATLLVSQADETFVTNKAKTLIVYTWSYTPGASAGLWTLAAP